MVFSSITFLFYFLPIVLFLYFISPKKFKNAVLLLASFVFYFLGEPKYVFIMLATIFVTYLGGLLIDKYKQKEKKNITKIIFILTIIINVGILIYFKYINFLIDNINLLLRNKIDTLEVILPIGISFYTFQILSYVIDLYRGNVKVQKNIFNLAMYVMLFPQLIAGPIVRYSTIEKELHERTCTLEKTSEGIKRFIIGLSKKVLIANMFGEFIEVFNLGNDVTVLSYWMYAIANMLQIYFDFSGYSDMAIGLGKIFGFEFLENFDHPYESKSITEFWRRWHMSLGSWFRDYIYIPLGGNKKGIKRQIVNILIVWMLTGLWHGAEWNFVIWGLFFGIILIIEKLFLLKWLEKAPRVISSIYVLFTVMISFIVFSAPSFEAIKINIFGLFNFSKGVCSSVSLYYLKSYLVLFVIGIIGSTKLFKNVFLDKEGKIKDFVEIVFLVLLLVVSTSYIIDGSFNPFLYFRF